MTFVRTRLPRQSGMWPSSQTPPTESRLNHRRLFPTVVEAGSPGWRCQAIRCLARTLFPAGRRRPPRCPLRPSLGSGRGGLSRSPSGGRQCHQARALPLRPHLTFPLSRRGHRGFGMETEGRRRGAVEAPARLHRDAASERWHRVGRDCPRLCSPPAPRTRAPDPRPGTRGQLPAPLRASAALRQAFIRSPL